MGQDLVEASAERKGQDFIRELHKFAASVASQPCDKCGLPVPAQNSAIIFAYINSLGTDWTLHFAGNRHLQPVADADGVVICEGSPSRWQYVTGVRDSRPEYARPDKDDESSESGYKIWEIMQTLANQELKQSKDSDR